MVTRRKKHSRRYGVVVVEDSKSDACLIVEGLKQDGRNVEILLLPDGEKASFHFGDCDADALFPRVLPDLILLDLNLPKKSGSELITEIRATPRLNGVPVVVFSGSQRPEEVWNCYNLGANLVVPKPLAVEPFIKLVSAIEHYFLDVISPDAKKEP